MTEQQRLFEERNTGIPWKKWGPYVSERQWGTVREDYSPNGDAWNYTTHDIARSKAWRWGEEGIAGICDDKQLLCFALALWNKKDPIIKERYFGLANQEGNHGEDVKELYYYLDSTPTHSYMKLLYKYPQQEYPYTWLLEENKRRNRHEPEFELMDTGIFNDNRYFDVFVEYAKEDAEDILIRITVHNRGPEDASLHIMPTIWFRNTWTLGYDDYKPHMTSANDGGILIDHRDLGLYKLHLENQPQLMFCENETNIQRLYNQPNQTPFCKDGINEYIVHGNKQAINSINSGTKAAVNYDLTIKSGQSATVRLRLKANGKAEGFETFDGIFGRCIAEADAFYAELQKENNNDDEKMVQRQAFAGMLWSKQWYHYNVNKWLKGDPAEPPPPPQRENGRNHEWKHLNNFDIISMPDKWEYPWFAAWDLAFHCLSFALIDPDFAKSQLSLLTREWYMHPNGQLPAYEWDFSDVNPPVHAWAAFRVYKIDQKNNGGKADIAFLESMFHKLMINFTWWVNRKDEEGNNIFEGGFLGLDNIGVFDRNSKLPNGGYIEQADGTSWMAMFSLNLMQIALELAVYDPVYQEMATKFFDHFLYIAAALANIGNKEQGLWDDTDQFFYDMLKMPNGENTRMKVRSVVGLIPMFAVEVLDHAVLQALPGFAERLRWFLDNRPDLAALVSRWEDKNEGEKHLLSLLRGHRMRMLLVRMLDENEFFSDHGVRALSKYHQKHPFEIYFNGTRFSVEYTPGESNTNLFGGNSNWRGPVWMPINFLLVESLQRFHYYYGDDFKVECPTHSGVYMSLNEVADELSKRLSRLFLRDESGRRPVFGHEEKFQRDPHFMNYLLFYEYFHGDTGRGLGASHQTGWTGLVARLLQPRKNPWPEVVQNKTPAV